KLNYSVEYYLEGTDAPFDTLKDQSVLVAKPEVKAVADSSNVPAGYTRSTTAPKLPTTITASNNVIKVYYKVDESQKLDYSVEHYLDGETFPFDITTQLSVLVASPEVKNVSDSDTLPAGYTRNRVEPVLPTTITKENKVIKIIYSENEITINYTADTNGSVTNASETIHAVSGKPQGSTATASNGYHFVNWTNEAGEVVSTDAAYVPAKVGGLHVAATYTAHFEADPVAPPTEPTPDEPTGTTPDGPTPAAAPTAATGVLGEAFAPVQPEVGVLGEALAPEVGVLGEAKGPGTGDAAPIAGWSLLIVGAIITLGITARKRKKEEQ
uniref:InlB B-repeat-containing protein n=1 Tax=Eisenbergiella sp. TaxID=1924109 RepID=UPI002A7F719A